MPRLIRVFTGLLVTCFLVAPAILVIAAGRMLDDEPVGLKPVPTPVLSTPVRTERHEERPVLVELRSAPGPRLLAPAWTGTVTRVIVESGAVLETGSQLVAVDRSVVIAAHTVEPFTRSLRRGDRGSDVLELQGLLLQLGYRIGEPDGVFGSETAKIIKQWRTDLQDSSPSEIFEPATVIWLPTPTFEVGEVMLTTGAPVPTAGTAVVFSPAGVSNGVVIAKDGKPIDNDAATYQLIVAGSYIGPVSTDTLSATQSEVLAALVDDGAVEVSDPGKPADEASTADAPIKIDGVLRNEDAFTAVQIPAGSILGSAPSNCVLTPGPLGTYTSVSVTVVGGALGVVYVGELDVDSVIANPVDVDPSASC